MKKENDSLKNHICLVIVVFLTVMIVLPVGIAYAQQADYVMARGAAIADAQIDGAIGSEWNDASTYSNVPVAPSATGQLWLKQDGTFLYVALAFQADSNKPWVALELGGDTCMSMDADGALFGDSTYCPNGYADISFKPLAGISCDAVQDGKGAMTVNQSNFVTIELKKPLSCGDTAGKDINWTVDNTYSFLAVWDSNGSGSSGGSADHSLVVPNRKTILLSANPVPEFPSAITLLIALVTVASMLLLAKRRKLVK